jgi:CheY-like chemotaxis protein
LPKDIISFQTDRIKLDSIITNLIKNAIKFTTSGSVEFGCRLKTDDLVFYVKDTGAGIPEDRLNLVFDRFVQADHSSSRPHEGSGLGLSIVKAYICMLNGKIWVHSEPGKGSTFSFSIPYCPVNEEFTQKEMIINSNDATRYKATFLIADDDYASYLYLEKLLSGKDVAFLHTTNGTETVTAIRDNPGISLILMDIRMPGMSGLDATRQIRQFNKSVPIIAQTAYSLAGDREMAIEAGCSDYISKPVNGSDLQKMISRYIGKKQL